MVYMKRFFNVLSCAALLLLGGRGLPLGIFMDVETNAQMEIPAVQLEHTVMAFCQTVKEAGYRYLVSNLKIEKIA